MAKALQELRRSHNGLTDADPAELDLLFQALPSHLNRAVKRLNHQGLLLEVGKTAAIDVKKGVIQSARVALTGAASHATRLTGVEKALEGKPASAESIEAAARNAGAHLKDLNSDIHASADYRRAMVQVFSERALKGALARIAND